MPREHLIRLIREDRTLARDARRLRALLNDHCPSGGSRLRALLEAQAHGIVLELEAAATQQRDMLLSRMASHLFEEAGLRQDLCDWAVETWHLALTTGSVKHELGTVHHLEEKPTHPSTPLSAARSPGETLIMDLGAGVKMELVLIPPGEFQMGSPASEAGRRRDETQHPVTLTWGFWMGKTEVTQEQWKQAMGNNPSHFKGAHNPVESVSWDDCQKFLNRLNSVTKGQRTDGGQLRKFLNRLNSKTKGQRTDGGQFRLPTEAEWEYACRAGTPTRYHNGDEERGLGDVAWYCENSASGTHPVGQKEPNAWGLYDMRGNVWEWCLDWYGSYPDGSVTDPRGPSTGSCRVFRGGGWLTYAGACRVGDRGNNYPVRAYNTLGFRAVLPPGPAFAEASAGRL